MLWVEWSVLIPNINLRSALCAFFCGLTGSTIVAARWRWRRLLAGCLKSVRWVAGRLKGETSVTESRLKWGIISINKVCVTHKEHQTHSAAAGSWGQISTVQTNERRPGVNRTCAGIWLCSLFQPTYIRLSHFHKQIDFCRRHPEKNEWKLPFFSRKLAG